MAPFASTCYFFLFPSYQRWVCLSLSLCLVLNTTAQANIKIARGRDAKMLLIAIAALITAITADLPSIIPDDVPFVPTTSAAAAKALRWAHVGPQDTFFELGCGDGRVALEALRLGASVVCVEQDPKLAAQADAALQAELGKPSFHGSRTAKVVVGDVFDENLDLSGATVVYFFSRHTWQSDCSRCSLSSTPARA